MIISNLKRILDDGQKSLALLTDDEQEQLVLALLGWKRPPKKSVHWIDVPANVMVSWLSEPRRKISYKKFSFFRWNSS